MKLKTINKSKGFTIIETLIVLAIAATIFLVVFLAVSALDRSSRNTARKDDAAALLAAIGDYAADNNGALPPTGTTLTGTPPSLTIQPGGSGNVPVSLKLSHYTNANVTWDTAANGTAIGTGGISNDNLVVDENSTCATSSTAAIGSTGAYAIVFDIESGSATGWAQQCIGS